MRAVPRHIEVDFKRPICQRVELDDRWERIIGRQVELAGVVAQRMGNIPLRQLAVVAVLEVEVMQPDDPSQPGLMTLTGDVGARAAVL